jgi:hypothetical protein
MTLVATAAVPMVLAPAATELAAAWLAITLMLFDTAATLQDLKVNS